MKHFEGYKLSVSEAWPRKKETSQAMPLEAGL